MRPVTMRTPLHFGNSNAKEELWLAHVGYAELFGEVFDERGRLFVVPAGENVVDVVEDRGHEFALSVFQPETRVMRGRVPYGPEVALQFLPQAPRLFCAVQCFEQCGQV